MGLRILAGATCQSQTHVLSSLKRIRQSPRKIDQGGFSIGTGSPSNAMIRRAFVVGQGPERSR